MKHFMILVPGYPYAMDVYGVDEADARRNYRDRYGLLRLRNGTVMWEVE